jgi:hypothetical protein
MPKIVTPLTDTQAKNAKPREKSYKLFDGGGLYLEVTTTGSKLWRMKFVQANGKEGRLAFGSYPEVSLADAREKRKIARTQRAGGIDPAQAKRIAKQEKATSDANTFEAVAREWHANKLETCSGLNLSYTFSCDFILAANFFESKRIPNTDPKTQTKNIFFLWLECG